MDDNLNETEKLVVSLAKVTLSADATAEIGRLAEAAVDWYAVLGACIRNKTLPLAWSNLRKLRLEERVPLKIQEICSFYAVGVARKNKALISQFHEVSDALMASGIRHAPLKGIVLCNEVYAMNSRQLADVDLMVSKDDISRVRETMNSLGFMEGEYDRVARRVRPLDRQKKVLWGLYMYNLPAFMKALDDEYLKVAEIDFTFDIRFGARDRAADAFLSRTVHYAPLGCECLMPEEFLLHLCCHLYKEAKNVLWVEREADFNLIKFCDVREYTLHVWSSLNIDRFVSLAREYDVTEPVYFTFYYLSQIYRDGYESSILRHLPAMERAALHSYGERDLGVGVRIEGSFWSRFFNANHLPAQHVKSTYSSFVSGGRGK